jgi:acetyl-CoA acyltransferase
MTRDFSWNTLPERTAVIVDAVRTPMGRAHAEKGWFRETRGDDLAVACVRALIERNALDPNEVDDVIMGCTQQTGEAGMNAGRNIALMAGLPETTAGCTIDRLCGSSMQALHQATHAIAAGAAEVQIAGGFEHMHHLPMDFNHKPNPKLFRVTSKAALHMGATAEFLAQTRGISREEQDAFAHRSHQRAARAHAAGEFRREIVPLPAKDDSGLTFMAESDQCVRFDSSVAALVNLEPAFVPKYGTVTAGNSSPLNDGAAALLVMSEAKAKSLGLKPLARVRSTSVVGLAPSLMGLGPVVATKKLFVRAGLDHRDIDLVELNEAFAVQALACVRELEIDEEHLNVRGGAIALGHPLGASGARIVTTLVHTMRDRGLNLGLATMCIGLGQGIATLLEN